MVTALELQNKQRDKVKEVIKNYIENVISPALEENALAGKYTLIEKVSLNLPKDSITRKDTKEDLIKKYVIKDLFNNINIDEHIALVHGYAVFEGLLDEAGYFLEIVENEDNKYEELSSYLYYDVIIKW